MTLITVISVNELSASKQYVIHSASLAKVVLLPDNFLLVSTNAACHSSDYQQNLHYQSSKCSVCEDSKCQLRADINEDEHLYS
jgi:hypothetical protein